MLRHLLIVTAILTSAFARGAPDRILFLNTPETVARPTRLADLNLPVGSTRAFFHYVNGSHRPVFFRIHVDGVHSSAHGFGLSPSPGRAGSAGALAIRLSPVAGDLDVEVPAGWVVSGALDVRSAGEVRLRCSMGDPQPGSRLVGKNTLASRASVRHAGERMRVGYGGEGLNEGDYGVEHTLAVRNDSPHPATYQLFASPRGGPAEIVWALDGRWRCTGLTRAKRTARLATVTVPPGGQFSLSTVPVGGYSYPLDVWVRRV